MDITKAVELELTPQECEDVMYRRAVKAQQEGRFDDPEKFYEHLYATEGKGEVLDGEGQGESNAEEKGIKRRVGRSQRKVQHMAFF